MSQISGRITGSMKRKKESIAWKRSADGVAYLRAKKNQKGRNKTRAAFDRFDASISKTMRALRSFGFKSREYKNAVEKSVRDAIYS